MSEKYFDTYLDPNEHIRQELKDEGMISPDEWRKVYDMSQNQLDHEHGALFVNPKERQRRIDRFVDAIINKRGIFSLDDLEAFENKWLTFGFNLDKCIHECKQQPSYEYSSREYKETTADEVNKDKIRIMTLLVEIEDALGIDEPPNIDILIAKIESRCKELEIDEEIFIRFRNGIRKYYESRKNVTYFINWVRDPHEMYKRCFGQSPEDKVEVLQFGMTLVFRCYSFHDFSKAAGEDESKAKYAWGYSLNRVEESILGNLVTLEHVSPDNGDPKKLWVHEQQHKFFKLFTGIKEAYGKNRIPVLASIFAAQPTEQNLEILVKNLALQERIEIGIDEYAKDEIIAQYSEGETSEATFNTMSQSSLYQYSSKFADKVRTAPSKVQEKILRWFHIPVTEEDSENNEADPHSRQIYIEYKIPFYIDNSIIDPMVYNAFKEGYSEDLREWIDGIKILEDKGYNRKEIVALLNTEDIHRWNRMARRLPPRVLPT